MHYYTFIRDKGKRLDVQSDNISYKILPRNASFCK